MGLTINLDLSMVDDEVADIERCLNLIFATPLGSMPGARAFGIDPSLLDYPAPMAQALLAAQIVEQVNKYEPRVTVTDITWTADDAGELAAKVAIKRV